MGPDAFVFLFLLWKRRIDGTAKREQIEGVSYGRWDWGEMQKRNVQTAVKLMG
jgi:hypothetical protein